MRVYIIGYMGSGKSTLVPKVARHLGIPGYDLDHLFEQRYKISIHDFFRKYGEKHFREIEHDLLKSLLSEQDFILATGGGTPCFFENMQLMNESGLTIYLRLPPAALLKRLSQSKKRRPVLQNFEEESLGTQLAEHLDERELYYMQAQWILEILKPDPQELAEKILNHFNPPSFS